MQTPAHPKSRSRRTWLGPAIIATILFIGGIASSLVTNYIQTSLDPYRRWVWVCFAIAFIVTIAVAIREARRAEQSTDSPAVSSEGERSVATGGDIKDSNTIPGDENVAVAGSKIGGDVFGGDKITQIYQTAGATATALHQLRSPVGDFVGRQQEIDALINALRSGNRACISGISGMGGIGKSELALLVAQRLSPEYPDAQLLINLQGTDPHPRRPEDALAIFIRAFLGAEARLPNDLDKLIQLYRSELSQRRVLIVLDNAADGAQVRPLLPPAGCALLVTSRETVTLPGMIPLTLSPLTVPEARKLVFEIAPHAAPVADQICQLCGYLPLAIRAAGSLLALTADLDPADYVAQLKDERSRLKRIGIEGVEIDVEASFNLSYARLVPEAARVFRQLAVFPATFGAAAEEIICADLGHAHLSNLVRHSLVLYDTGAKRYRLHDLVRLFADARLSEDDRSTARRLHATHYKELLAVADELYLEGGEAFARGLALFDLEWVNIEAGHTCAEAEGGGNDEAAQLCIAYPDAGAYVLLLRQHPRERIRWLEMAVSAARRLRQRESEVNALGNLGNAYTDLRETKLAIGIYEQVLNIAREIGDRRVEGSTLDHLGVAYRESGETSRAIAFHEQALLIEREIGYRRGEGNAMGNLGNAYANLGESSRAIESYDKQLFIAREIGDRRGEGIALFNKSLALDVLGKRAEAITNSEEALTIMEQIEDPNAEQVRAKLAKWQATPS